MKILLLALAIPILLAAGCKKENAEDQLPPATQTGANTFGCLINGKVYTPQGSEQNHSNFEMIVDPTFQNGNFGISTFNKKLKIRVNIGTNSINNTGTLFLEDTLRPILVDVINDNTNCRFNPSFSCIIQGICYSRGYLSITRYDLANKIFSGQFEFHLYDPSTSCDTIHVTQGRFDKKL